MMFSGLRKPFFLPGENERAKKECSSNLLIKFYPGSCHPYRSCPDKYWSRASGIDLNSASDLSGMLFSHLTVALIWLIVAVLAAKHAL